MDDEGLIEHGRQVATGTFWGLVGTFFTKVVSFLYTVYVARAVSQGDIGLFYLSLGFVGLFIIWKDFGLSSAITRYVPYYESQGEGKKAKHLLESSYAIAAVSGIFFTITIWLAADSIGAIYQNQALPEALKLMSFFMLLDNLSRISAAYLGGKAEIKLGQVMGTVSVITKLILTYALFQLYGANYQSMTLAFLGSALVPLAISTPWIIRIVKSSPASGSALAKNEMLREIVPFGIMLTLVQAFYGLISSIDRLLIGYLVPQTVAIGAVAVYSLAITLSINVTVFPGLVGNIFLPLISRMVGKHDHDGIKRSIGTAQRWVLLLTLPVILVLIVFANEMMTEFFGSPYGQGGMVAAIFAFGLGFTAYSYIIGLALAGMRLVKLELQIAVVGAVANILLNLLLIPSFGAEGAAAAAAASFAIMAMMFMHYGKTILGFHPSRNTHKIIALGFALLLIIYAAKPHFAYLGEMPPDWLGEGELAKYAQKTAYLAFLGVVLASVYVLYWLLALLFKCFEWEDVRVFSNMAKKTRLPKNILEFVETMLMTRVRRPE